MASTEHEAILSPIKSLNDSNTSDSAIQTKLVIREGQLRVEQVQVEVRGDEEVINISNVSSVSAASSGSVSAASSDITATSSTSDNSATSANTATSVEPVKPSLISTIGGEEAFKEWLVSHISSSIQYTRSEPEICGKIKRDFPTMTDIKDVTIQLRAAVEMIDLVEIAEEGPSPQYRTSNVLRYLIDSCITIHFFMKGTGGVERMIKDNHSMWYEDVTWPEMGISYDCFQRILKGKVTKAMNGAIANKYNSWPGVKEFAQKHTFSAIGHFIKFGELARLVKKEFNAPHDIIKHIKMDEVLKFCLATIPGVELMEEGEGEELEERMVTTLPSLLDLIKKVKHLLNNGVKNVSKDFSSFYPTSKDWGAYHLSYQKLSQYFRNFFHPTNRRRRSAPGKDDENEIRYNSSIIYDSTANIAHLQLRKGPNPAIAVNTVVERSREKRRTEEERHYAERGETRNYRNGLAERDENTTVYLNPFQRSIIGVIGLPGTGKTTTIATLLGRTIATIHSTVLIISSNCTTTNTLLQYTTATVLRACPTVKEAPAIEEEDESFIIHEVIKERSDPTKEEEKKKKEDEEDKPVIALPYSGVEEMKEGEFKITELPWKLYDDPSEVINKDSVGRITALHFPTLPEAEDAEAVCGALETFEALHSDLPKILIIDNMDCLCHPCNNSTVDRLIEKHRDNEMSIWITATHPTNLPYNLLDFADITILHRYTSKFWHNELADHLSLTSTVYQTAQELAPGHAIIVAPGAKMQHPIHSNSNCYPCSIVTPIPTP